MARTGATATVVMLLVLAATPALLSGQPAPAGAVTNCTVPSGEELLNSTEQQMLAAVNAERTSRGLAALKPSPSLNRAAAWKSLDSSARPPEISHTDSLGRDPSRRARDCGYSGSAAENIAYGHSSVEATVAAWMGSSGHRGNILNASYVVVGVGLGPGPAWTLKFGIADDSGVVAAPTRASTATPTRTPTRTPTLTPAAPPFATPTPNAAPAPAFSMSLAEGVNYVVYTGAARSVGQVFSSLGGALIGAYHWDAARGRWDRYAVGAPAYVSNFSSMKPGEVYAILLSRDATWTY